MLVHHEHHGQRHLGKSEVCGLVGDPLQAFGPALARQGFGVLAPDSICFADRLANQTGLEMAEVIPGFTVRYDAAGLLTCFAPRHILIVSASYNPFSHNAERVVATAQPKCIDRGSAAHITHCYAGDHALTHEYFDDIVRWLIQGAA